MEAVAAPAEGQASQELVPDELVATEDSGAIKGRAVVSNEDEDSVGRNELGADELSPTELAQGGLAGDDLVRTTHGLVPDELGLDGLETNGLVPDRLDRGELPRTTGVLVATDGATGVDGEAPDASAALDSASTSAVVLDLRAGDSLVRPVSPQDAILAPDEDAIVHVNDPAAAPAATEAPAVEAEPVRLRSHARVTAESVPSLSDLVLRLYLPASSAHATDPDRIAANLHAIFDTPPPIQRTAVVDGEVLDIYLLAHLPPPFATDASVADNLLSTLQIGIDVVLHLETAAGQTMPATVPTTTGARGLKSASSARASLATIAAPAETGRRSVVAIDTRESYHDSTLPARASVVANTSASMAHTGNAPTLYRLPGDWVAYALRARVAVPSHQETPDTDVLVHLVVTINQRLLPSDDSAPLPPTPSLEAGKIPPAANDTDPAHGPEAKTITIDSVVQHLSRKAVVQGTAPSSRTVTTSRRSLARLLSVVTPIAVSIDTVVMADRRALIAVRATSRLWDGIRAAQRRHAGLLQHGSDLAGPKATPGAPRASTGALVATATQSQASGSAAPLLAASSAGPRPAELATSPPLPPLPVGSSSTGATPATVLLSVPSPAPSTSSVAASLRLRASNLTASMQQALGGGHRRTLSATPSKAAPPLPTVPRPSGGAPVASRPQSMASSQASTLASVIGAGATTLTTGNRRLPKLDPVHKSRSSFLGDADWLRQGPHGDQEPWETEAMVVPETLAEEDVPLLRVTDIRLRLGVPDGLTGSRVDLDTAFKIQAATDHLPMDLAPAESGAAVAHLLLLGDQLPAEVVALGLPCILNVTVRLKLVPRRGPQEAVSTDGVGGPHAHFSFGYRHPIDLVHLFGSTGPRRDFTLSLTGSNVAHRASAEPTPIVVHEPFYVRLVVANDTAVSHDLSLRLGDSLRVARETKALPEQPRSRRGAAGNGAAALPVAGRRVPTATAGAAPTGPSKGPDTLVARSLENNLHLGRIEPHSSIHRRVGFLATEPGVHVLPALLVEAIPDKTGAPPGTAVPATSGGGTGRTAVMAAKPLRVVVAAAASGTLAPSSRALERAPEASFAW